MATSVQLLKSKAKRGAQVVVIQNLITAIMVGKPKRIARKRYNVACPESHSYTVIIHTISVVFVIISTFIPLIDQQFRRAFYPYINAMRIARSAFQRLPVIAKSNLIIPPAKNTKAFGTIEYQ